MKAWLNATWAKLAAFFLTLLFGLATVLGGLGIGILAYNNVFLDRGESLRQGLYQEQCYIAIDTANSFICGQLDSVGLMDRSYYYSSTDTSTTVAYDPETAQQRLDDLPRLFAEEFPRESSACQLNVFDPDSGEVWFSNFDLTGGEKYSIPRRAPLPITWWTAGYLRWISPSPSPPPCWKKAAKPPAIPTWSVPGCWSIPA